MSATALSARIGYAISAFAVVGASAFYAGMWLLPRFMPDTSDEDGGYGIFRSALVIALGLAFSAALVGLTLPWKRRKRHRRGKRIAISAAVVVIASTAFASQQHNVVLDLLFAAWLAYTLAFTYVRYGVRDKPSSRSSEGMSGAVPE